MFTAIIDRFLLPAAAALLFVLLGWGIYQYWRANRYEAYANQYHAAVQTIRVMKSQLAANERATRNLQHAQQSVAHRHTVLRAKVSRATGSADGPLAPVLRETLRGLATK